MSTYLAAVLTLVLLAAVIGLLERTHRHDTRVPHAPLGGDTAHDSDFQRVLHDLDVRRA
jgi:hypothetical protein